MRLVMPDKTHKMSPDKKALAPDSTVSAATSEHDPAKNDTGIRAR